MPWTYDPAHSRIGFIVTHHGLVFVHGHFQNADVQIDIPDDDPCQASMSVTIDVASLTTYFPRRDEGVKGENYLEADLYPTITFTSTRVEPRGENRYAVIGDFTLRGITRPLVLDTTYAGEFTDYRGVTLRGLAGRASIRKSDFGIKGHPLEMNVGEEIQLVVDVELHAA
jgi:polyisoprenoid-binding protein YceI